MTAKGVLIAAPSSRSGKTTFTLGLIRALCRNGHGVNPAKSGPDYIDTAFLSAAASRQAVNLDAFAMSTKRLRALVPDDGVLVAEGAMGLFDGAPPDGTGSAAQLAKTLGLAVILVVDCASTAQSIAPIISGFLNHDPNITIAGIVLNRVGSARHEAILRAALNGLEVPILGVVMRDKKLHRASRHLGLVQAREDAGLASFLDHAADRIEASVNLDQILTLATPIKRATNTNLLPLLGKNIAIARDDAFAFVYAHMLADWTAQGAKISYFSPLKNETPQPDCDAIFLPGGYPELHARTLARAGNFRAAMQAAAAAQKTIYGECGGYMVLGQSIEDAQGIRFPMCGLLDLSTSFARRKLHLGYRNCTATAPFFSKHVKAHEFHYASILQQTGTPLFQASDAQGRTLEPMGLVNGSVSGSFAHIIDLA